MPNMIGLWGGQLLPPYVRYEIRFSSSQKQRLLGRILEALGRYAKYKKMDTPEGGRDQRLESQPVTDAAGVEMAH
jgi:hypothetical protein